MFEWKGTIISARELTIADENQIRALAMKLNDATPFNDGYEWAEFLSAAVIHDESPIPPVAATDSEDAARASYAAWQKMPRRFLREWRAELRAAELPNA